MRRAGEVETGPGVALLYFPNREPISLDDKEVEFDTRVGPFEVKYKFKTKDMVIDGKLAV